jgi:hypothetical protein
MEGPEYEPYKREPQYAHAQSSALWELVCFFFLVVLSTTIAGAYLWTDRPGSPRASDDCSSGSSASLT